MRKYITVVILWLSPVAESREWRNHAGKTIEGEYIRSTATKVTIKRDMDGKTFSIPIASLSMNDQAFVRYKKAQGGIQPPMHLVEPFKITLHPAPAEDEEIHLKLESINNREDIFLDQTLTVKNQLEIYLPAIRIKGREEKLRLRIKSKNYSAQWHILELSKSVFMFRAGGNIDLHKKRYAILQYAFYKGDERNLTKRKPTYQGTLAVGHWGKLSGSSVDWQVWQADTENNRFFGGTLCFQNHRIGLENGFIGPLDLPFDKLSEAPATGYKPPSAHNPLQIEEGKSYYSKVTGHHESLKGYAKIYVKDIVFTPPDGMQVIGGE